MILTKYVLLIPFLSDTRIDESHPCIQPPRKKSKAEVMSEVIAKSKEHKVSWYDLSLSKT